MRRASALAVLAVSALVASACEEENPFRRQDPVVTFGTTRVWELALEGFPSAFDFAGGTRFAVGTTQIGALNGTWVLDSRDDGTLVIRPFSTLVPEFSRVRTGILDVTEELGVQTFEALTEAPSGGYTDPDSAAGVPVVQGHVYAFRISRISGQLVPINFGKMEILEVGREFPDDPRSRFVRFRWAYQNQPLNRNLVVEEEAAP